MSVLKDSSPSSLFSYVNHINPRGTFTRLRCRNASPLVLHKLIKIHLTLKLILSRCYLALHALHTEPGVNAALRPASLPLLGCLTALALARLVTNELVSLFARGNSRASVGAGRKSRGFLCKDAQIHHLLRLENNFFFWA